MSSKASRDAPAQRGQPDDTLQWAGNLSSLPSLRSWDWHSRHPALGTVGTQQLLYWLCRKPQSVWNCFIYEGCQSAQSQCLLYLASSDLSVSLLSDVSSFASKSRTDIIRTRLETCSAHIRSPSLTGSVTHSSQSAGEKKLESVGISNLPETDFYVTTKVFILSSSRQHISPQQLWLNTTPGYFYKVRGGREMSFLHRESVHFLQ